MDNKNQTIRISVRNLVEFVLRSGDIDNRHTTGADVDAMLAGGRLHRKIQGRMGADYKAEVPLKISVPYEEFEILVDGRADGIIEGETITIDEIKGVRKDISYINEPVFVHKAQAMCYAFIYSKQNELDKIRVQMTYINLETEEIKKFEEEFDAEYLKRWFYQVVDEYYKWAKYLYENKNLTMSTANILEFPYEYRKGQRDVVVNVFKAFRRKVDLFVQAPTGIGKTLSVIFPSVKAFGEGICDKIFYLTAKTITGSVAVDGFNILREKGLCIKSVTITAKEKMCVMDETKCNPDYCKRAKGHYDRINEAVFDIINNESDITREKILEYAEKHNVCPFEINLDISDWVDGIICDYNYAFDPKARLKRYFGESKNGSYIFLVDEAHNLVDRAREMYSAVLIKEDVLKIKKLFANKDKRVSGNLEKLNRAMLYYKRMCDTGFLILSDTEKMTGPLMRYLSAFEKYIEEHGEFEDKEEAMNLYFAAKTFQDVYEIMDENYEIYCGIDEDGAFFIKIMCINPSVRLMECMDKTISTIFFSATLLPVNYYKMLITGNMEDYAVYIESPFDRQKRVIAIGNDVTSKYTRRGREEYEKIAIYIKKIIKKRLGNYMIFFPSYKMLKEVYDIFEEIINFEEDNIRIILQKNSMDERDRENFLKEFDENGNNTLIGFCVMGGIFSEGIDLKNDKLIGSIIVGTGLPLVCKERELIAEYFNGKGMNGFDFAYKVPGMNKVLQSAGRVIRTTEDKGIIILLDNRFSEKSYSNMFPREWDDIVVTSISEIETVVDNFWNNFEDENK